MPLNAMPFNVQTLRNRQNFRNTRLASPHEIPPEQKENIQQLRSDLQGSVDSPPSEESIDQLQTTVQTALEDGTVTPEEGKAIAQASVEVFESMGLTSAEMRTLVYDVQNIAENSRFPGEDEELVGTDSSDFLLGKTGSDVLVGTPTNGQGEVDLLIGGGGSDTFVLGDATTAYYDDGERFTTGVNDFAAIADFNIAYDTIQLHGNEGAYSLGALPNDLPMQGTALYYMAQGELPELIAIVAGVEVADFSQGFTFVG